MEAITGATLFATFVSLITQYKSEVTSRKTKDVNDFKDWLNEKSEFYQVIYSRWSNLFDFVGNQFNYW